MSIDQQINVLNKGFVRLDNCMADDISVVNAARVSFGKKVDTLSDGDSKLINFLMREHHGTPFEHNAFRFHIKCPIFVAREWFRHRIGWSYNEFSARYTEMPADWYTPAIEDVRSQVGRPGNYTFEPVDVELAEEMTTVIEAASNSVFRTYNFLLANGVAKELARSILPVGMYTEFYATCNARSLMHFLSLRNHASAQLEIRKFAAAIEDIFKQVMPATFNAYVENGRIAP